MERGPGPGSASRREGGPRKFDHLARYAAPGAYIIDEATGEYSEYEVPQQGEAVSWDDIDEAPPYLIAADFASEYGITLARDCMSWREFVWRISGLLSADTRLARYLHALTNDEEVTDGR